MRIAARCVLGTLIAMTVTAAPAAGVQAGYAPTRIPMGAGSVTPIGAWQIQDSAKAQEGGAEISAPAYATKAWLAASGRATVMAGLLENAAFKNDVFYSDNLRAVQVPDSSGNLFVTPWWYRSAFVVGDTAKGEHTLLRTNGMIASADVWVNGHLVADHADVAGAYPVHEFDVTAWVHAGTNIVALQVRPADPRTSLSIGWVDWNPTPPDNNMGPWRGVDIVRAGPVQLSSPQVRAAVSLPGLAQATLDIKVTVKNLDTITHDVTISGTAADAMLSRTVHLGAGQSQVISFSRENTPALKLDHPRIWWPIGMGDHPLYTLELTATVAGTLADRASTTFGIRSVSSSLTKQGYRQFFINGKPLLIRGGGWAPDMFLRDNPARMDAEFSYVRNLGLNTIRSEGKLESQRFYDLADRDGIMILPGWECCDKWESAAGTGGSPWDAADMQVAGDSMASEARLLANHPSVIGFYIGSDNPPPPPVAKLYVAALRDAGWQLPIISAAVPKGTAEAGLSGMKMAGPYDWIPPSYWYADQLGGAFGFDSEVSAGADIPRLEDIRRMLSPQEQDALWKLPDARQYHASADWSTFAVLTPFDKALAARYGAPTSLADYVAKAQLDNYDNTRAQFEAFNAHMDATNPATGVIYWMLNNAWPSLHWHLYDYYLNPAGAYFGAKKGNELLHIQYSYDTHAIVLVNHALDDSHGLQAHIRVRNLDGSVRYEKQVGALDVMGNRTREIARVPKVEGLSPVYFIELELAASDGKPVSRNVYWLSTKADVLNWEASNWYLTPLAQYGDFTALRALPGATSQASAGTVRDGDDAVTTVTLSVPPTSPAVALQQHVSIRRGPQGDLALPIVWSDNDVTLWPGESIVLTARYPWTDGADPVVEVTGWNLAQGTDH